MEPIGDAMALEIRHLRAEVARLTEENGQHKSYNADLNVRCLDLERQLQHRAAGEREYASRCATKDEQIASLKALIRRNGETFREQERDYLAESKALLARGHSPLNVAYGEIKAKAEANAALARECEEMGK